MLPKLETLPDAQRQFWPHFAAVGSEFVLYESTALSLQVGGRRSVDFDFFTSRSLDVERLAKQMPFLKNAQLRNRANDAATFMVGGGIAVSFFGSLGFGRVGVPTQYPDVGIYAASLPDLAAQKVKVIQQRAEAKDYLDIHKLLSVGISLETALDAARALFPEFNAAISLKALAYFKDVPHLPTEIQRDLIASASRVGAIAPVSKQSESLLPGDESIVRSPDFENIPLPPPEARRQEPELEI